MRRVGCCLAFLLVFIFPYSVFEYRRREGLDEGSLLKLAPLIFACVISQKPFFNAQACGRRFIICIENSLFYFVRGYSPKS